MSAALERNKCKVRSTTGINHECKNISSRVELSTQINRIQLERKKDNYKINLVSLHGSVTKDRDLMKSLSQKNDARNRVTETVCIYKKNLTARFNRSVVSRHKRVILFRRNLSSKFANYCVLRIYTCVVRLLNNFSILKRLL